MWPVNESATASGRPRITRPAPAPHRQPQPGPDQPAAHLADRADEEGRPTSANRVTLSPRLPSDQLQATPQVRHQYALITDGERPLIGSLGR